MNGDNCDQNGDNESLYLHGLKMCVAYEFVVCVTLTNNAELFLMPSRLKSHIILVLDRLQCVARANCLVDYNNDDTVKSHVNHNGNDTKYSKAHTN